jgi:hypothetical protein
MSIADSCIICSSDMLNGDTWCFGLGCPRTPF